MLPSKSTLVNSPNGCLSTWRDRWTQATRHMQGVAEVSYAVLAAWDLLRTVCVTDFSFCFVLNLIRVIERPVMMHLVMNLQPVAFGVWTVYWR